MKSRVYKILRSAASLASELAWALIGAVLASLIVPPTAKAYVDPSIVTYTIQAIAGVAVALGAVAGVALRRSRHWLMRLLHIDENAGKTLDPTVHRTEDDGELSAADERAVRVRSELVRGRPVRELPWPERFARALAICAFSIGTILVFAPLEMVAASSSTLPFGLFDVAGLIIGVGIAIAVASALLISLVHGQSFDVVLTCVAAVGLGAYVQSLFLNADLPLADGRPLIISDYDRDVVASIVVWAGLLVVLLWLNARRRALCRTLVPTLSILLLAVQVISMVGIARELPPDEAQASPIVMTRDGLNEVGAEGDVTVFVLDTFDTRIMEELRTRDPSILSEFTGFTYFRNSAGTMIPTTYAIPYLLTNQQPQPNESWQSYFNERYDRGTPLDDMAEQGYEIAIYTDSCDLESLEPYAMNFVREERIGIDGMALWLALEKMALYREMPWPLKPLFWFYTDELNAPIGDGYYIDDFRYGEDLRRDGLRISESANRTFRFIHMKGAHYPFTMNADGQRVREGDTNQLAQTEGSLAMVADYLRELKRLGLYNQSTIIVTADHGDWGLTDQPLSAPSTPVLLVKPTENAEEAALPMRTSDVPTGHLDLAATIVDAVGGDSSAYGPTVFEVTDEPRDRYYWQTLSNGHRNIGLQRYVIQGPVLDMDSWHLTGERIVIDE